MRANWWSFGMWFFWPARDNPRARLVYDLRCWLFGFRYHFGAWQINFGPFEFERLTTMEEPTKAA